MNLLTKSLLSIYYYIPLLNYHNIITFIKKFVHWNHFINLFINILFLNTNFISTLFVKYFLIYLLVPFKLYFYFIIIKIIIRFFLIQLSLRHPITWIFALKKVESLFLQKYYNKQINTETVLS